MKRSPARIDQLGALAAQRLGGERRRVAADVDGGRVELHELGIGDDRAGARGHAEAAALRFRRVGGDGVEVADAAGGQDHGARREIALRAPPSRRPSDDAGDPPVRPWSVSSPT